MRFLRILLLTLRNLTLLSGKQDSLDFERGFSRSIEQNLTHSNSSNFVSVSFLTKKFHQMKGKSSEKYIN